MDGLANIKVIYSFSLRPGLGSASLSCSFNTVHAHRLAAQRGAYVFLDYSAMAERFIPSFAIRDRSVFGLMPSWTAAPCLPEMTQLVFSSVDSM